MALDAQLLEHMVATITLENVISSSSGGWGARGFGPAHNVKARIEQYVARVQSHDGNEVVSKARVFAAPFDTSTSGTVAVSFHVPDRVTIPSGYILAADTVPRIISVEQHADEDGDVMYYELII